jgi:type IV secretory pathway VirB2 component (pilin)
MQSWPDGGNGGAAQSALQWAISVLYGPLGTTIAIISIALLGALMLTGRMPMRRGMQMVLALFLFFGAATLATIFVSQAPTATPTTAIADNAIPPTDVEATNVFDPYAGASTVRK